MPLHPVSGRSSDPASFPFQASFRCSGHLIENIQSRPIPRETHEIFCVIKAETPEGSAALIMSVYGLRWELLGYDYMYGRNISGISDWMKAEVVLDVPGESHHIQISIAMAGRREIWFLA